MCKPSTRIEDILDNCVTAIQEQGKTVADCLARYPAQREELEPLLRLTVRLQAARTLKATPEFRRVSAIRVRNLVAARSHRIGRAATRSDPLRRVKQSWPALFSAWSRLPVAVAISFLLAVWLLIGSGVVYASTDALPGDALYPVKRAVESTQLAVSLNDTHDARLRLAFATRRLDEVAALLKKGRPQDIDQALASYDVQIESVLALLEEDSELPSNEQATLADLLLTAQTHQEALFVVLFDQSPEETQPSITLALMTSRSARDRALQVLDGRPGIPEDLPELPGGIPTETPTPTTTPAQRPTPTLSPKPSITPTAPPSPEPLVTPTTPPSPTIPVTPTAFPSPTIQVTSTTPPSLTMPATSTVFPSPTMPVTSTAPLSPTITATPTVFPSPTIPVTSTAPLSPTIPATPTASPSPQPLVTAVPTPSEPPEQSTPPVRPTPSDTPAWPTSPVWPTPPDR